MSTQSSNTAVTENDKIVDARRKDAEKNLKSSEKADVEDHTAAHALLPSDVEGFAREHDLTTQEAGEALEGRTVAEATKEVDKIKAGRTVNRQVVIETPAGSSSPFEHNQRIAVVPPPDPSALDIHAPGPHDPTAYVIRDDAEERRAEEVRAAGAAYVEAADKATELVDEQTDESRKEDTTQVSTE